MNLFKFYVLWYWSYADDSECHEFLFVDGYEKIQGHYVKTSSFEDKPVYYNAKINMSLFFSSNKWRFDQTVGGKAGFAKATDKNGCPVDKNYEIQSDIKVNGPSLIEDGIIF